MAAIMGEWQAAIRTGGHKAVQQLQRERRGESEPEGDGVEEEGKKI